MSVPDRSKLNRFCLNCRNTAKEGGQWGVRRQNFCKDIRNNY